MGKTFLLELETTPSSSVTRLSTKQSPRWNGSAGVRIVKGLFPAANLFKFPSISIYLKSQTYIWDCKRNNFIWNVLFIFLSHIKRFIWAKFLLDKSSPEGQSETTREIDIARSWSTHILDDLTTALFFVLGLCRWRHKGIHLLFTCRKACSCRWNNIRQLLE